MTCMEKILAGKKGQGVQETRGIDQNCHIRAHQGRPLETVTFAQKRGAAGEGNHNKICGKSIPGRGKDKYKP